LLQSSQIGTFPRLFFQELFCSSKNVDALILKEINERKKSINQSKIIDFCVMPTCQTGKTTTIKRTADREAGVSQYHWDTI